MDTTAATIELRPTANASQFTRTYAVADTKEAPNLSLRPLKKHTNVRIGKKVDLTGYPSKSSLFCISNKHGWYFAGNENTIIVSPLSELRTALGQTNTNEEVSFASQVKLDLGATIPLFICLTSGENTLVAASSSVIMTWDVQTILNGQTTPSNSLTLNELVVVDVHPNPGDNPELVAVLTTGHSQDTPSVVLLYNCVTQTEMVRWNGTMREGTAPVAVSWSTRGKQIAIGTSGGDILQYSPTDPSAAKATIPHAQGPDLAGTIPIMIRWLSNYTFYVIYAAPRPEASLDDYQPDQHNYIVTYDKKNNHFTDTSIPLPWDPYGLSREPGHQITVLRGWGRFKHLIFANDAHASDVGIIGCIGDATASEEGFWSKISLEDESITFPLTSEMDDTSLVGMDMDLSADASLLGANQANGDDPTIPPSPILYLLTNDSVVVAFHIVSEDGLPYPGMVRASADQGMEMSMEKSQGMEMSMERSQGMEMSMEKSLAPKEPAKVAASALGLSVPTAPSFGQAGFGFGSAAAPKFGASGFGSAPATSPFGGFLPSHTTTGPTLGFGAFANSKPAFGQSSFGAPAAASSSAASPPAQTATPSSFGGGGFAAFAGPKPAFGQSSFGAPVATVAAFGQSAAATPATPVSPNAESTSGLSPAAQGPAQVPSKAPAVPADTPFKPASGFGAFSKLNTGGGGGGFNFTNPKPVDPQAKPLAFAGYAGASTSSATTAPKFGTPTALSQPKFGQSGLGAGFGQSAFGQPGFGQPASAPAKSPFSTATSTSSTTTGSSGGGFGAFSSAPTSFAALAKVATETKTTAHLGIPPDTPKPPTPATSDAKLPPQSVFGSNAAVGKLGFPGTALRSSTPKDDDDEDAEGKKETGERFPEDDIDKLEPETTYDGPGLFGPISGKGGKGKATKGLAALGLQGEGVSSSAKAEAGKPVVAFGQRIDSSKVAASAAAAFKSTPSVAEKSGQASSATVTPQLKNNPPVPPLSAFASAAKATPPSSPEKNEGSDDDEEYDEEDSLEIEVDDDINEFLEGPNFNGVDVVEGPSDEESADEEEEEEDEEEEELSDDLPEEGEEEPEEEPEEPGVRLRKGTQRPLNANKPVAAAAAPFNPFGRPASAASATAAKPSTQSLVDRSEKAAIPRETSASTGSPGPTPRPQPIIQPVGAPISSAQPKAKPKPASPKAAFGSWTPPPAKSAAESSKPARPQTPPGLFGKASPAQGAISTKGSSTPPPATSTKSLSTPVVTNTTVTSTTATPSTSKLNPGTPLSDQGQAARSVPAVQPVQPVHPELQAQLDRLLNEYSAVLFHITQRSRQAHAHFDAFKGSGPPVANEFQAPPEWSGQNIGIHKQSFDNMGKVTSQLRDRTSNLQRQLDDLSSSTLRLEMKKEEVSRYLRARQNPEFLEKIIKPRGLGPEHAESQIRLRKGLTAHTKRINEVEEQVQRLKKKVDSFRSGQLTMKVPNLDDIRKSCQNMEWFISDVQGKLDELTTKVDALPDHDLTKRPRRLSTAGSHHMITRNSSFGPEIIATTAETFSGEVKMTKLSELLVEARTAAPVYRVRTTPNASTTSTRKPPFPLKPVILRDALAARTPHPQPTSATQPQYNKPAPPSLPPNPLNTPMAPPVAPPQPLSSATNATKAAAADVARRGSAGANRTHSRAPQISKDGPVHTSSFSFGPPPAATSNAVKLPTNFVPLIPQTNSQPFNENQKQ